MILALLVDVYVYVPGYCYFTLFLGLMHLLLGDVEWRHRIPTYTIIHTFHACYTQSSPHGFDFKTLNTVSNYVLTLPSSVNVTDCTALRYSRCQFQFQREINIHLQKLKFTA